MFFGRGLIDDFPTDPVVEKISVGDVHSKCLTLTRANTTDIIMVNKVENCCRVVYTFPLVNLKTTPIYVTHCIHPIN